MERRNLIIAAVVVVALICVAAVASISFPEREGEKEEPIEKTWRYLCSFNGETPVTYGEKKYTTEMFVIEEDTEKWKLEWNAVSEEKSVKLPKFKVAVYQDSYVVKIVANVFGWDKTWSDIVEISRTGDFFLIIEVTSCPEWGIDIYYYA